MARALETSAGAKTAARWENEAARKPGDLSVSRERMPTARQQPKGGKSIERGQTHL